MPTLGTFEHDNLLAGNAEVVTESINVGSNLSRGTVVGIITETGQAVAVNSSATDGSEKPYAVLADDVVDARVATVYLTGEFNENALIFGGTDTVTDHKRALRDIGIFVKKNQEA